MTVEIRKQKREESLAKRRNLQVQAMAAPEGAGSDSEDEDQMTLNSNINSVRTIDSAHDLYIRNFFVELALYRIIPCYLIYYFLNHNHLIHQPCSCFKSSCLK